MHGGEQLGSIFGSGTLGLGWALPCLDEAVSALLEDLGQRGLLDPKQAKFLAFAGKNS
jgi:hypothetical protein